MSDININFDAHPVTGDITKLSDEASITQSIKTLVLTAFYERKFYPNLGSQVADALFENYSESLSEFTISKSIENVINFQEPRAKNVRVQVDFNEAQYAIEARITYIPVNSLDEITVKIPLERIR